MPVDFLTPEQEARYGQFVEEPTTEQLAKYFWLDDQDKNNVFGHRGEHNRLGYAVQLGTVLFLGTFLSDPTAVPDCVQFYVAQQLKLDVNSIAASPVWNFLRQPPVNLTSTGIIKAIDRLKSIRKLGATEWDMSGIPIGRIPTLARYSSMTKAQTIERMAQERQIATLAAFAIMFTISAQDDVLDMTKGSFRSYLFVLIERGKKHGYAL